MTVPRLCLFTAVILVATVAVIWFLLPSGGREYWLSQLSLDTAARTSGDNPDGRQPSDGAAFGQFEFDVSNATIPVDQILPGGPGKDGIRALTDPGFDDADAAGWLKADDRVIGVTMGNESRAYPLRILDQHEIVNDVVADSPIAVTYCPLCDSALVFDRRVGDETLELGVSGLLYNSNVLMFDRRPKDAKESLWSQMGPARPLRDRWSAKN